MNSLEVEALIKKIQCFKTLMHKDKKTILIIVILLWFQHISGTSFLILENNNQTIEHLNSIWITDFIRLLKQFKVQLNLQSTNIKRPQ